MSVPPSDFIINPDGLRNQIEGCIVQTVSRVLKEEVSFDRFMVTAAGTPWPKIEFTNPNPDLMEPCVVVGLCLSYEFRKKGR
jgi:hypothetical protein